MTRQCGDCQLCCKLLPVVSLSKKAGQRCQHQKHHKGCAVYHRLGMPPECAIWNCRWLINDDADDLSRPDRAHYVIDISPDFVTAVDNTTGEQTNVQIVQIWIDPKYPEAHRDPALRRWMRRRAEEGIATLVRYNSHDALTIMPPPLTRNGEWIEITGGYATETHSFADILQALGGASDV